MEREPSGTGAGLPPLSWHPGAVVASLQQSGGTGKFEKEGVLALPAVTNAAQDNDTIARRPTPLLSSARASATRATRRRTRDQPRQYLPCGQLFTWGRASSGQLGQERFLHPPGANCCALPYPVPGWTRVAHVSCGGLEEGFTVLSTDTGDVFSFGKDIFGRLGHGNHGRLTRHEPAPRLVQTLRSQQCRAVRVAAGAEHAMCLSEGGYTWSWGRNIGGCLGRGTTESPGFKIVVAKSELSHSDPRIQESLPSPVLDLGHGRSSWIGTHFGRLPLRADTVSGKKHDDGRPGLDKILANVIEIDCEYHYSAALLQDGRLVLWGSNTDGQLGVGDKRDRALPQQAIGLARVKSFSLGSRYAAAVTQHGAVFCWGEGVHGNLGLGDRNERLVPTRVTGNSLDLHSVVRVACSRGQGWHRSRGDQVSSARALSASTEAQKCEDTPQNIRCPN